MTRKFKHADGTTTTVTTGTFWDKNKTTIMIVGGIIIAGLIFIPKTYLKKVLPFIK
jgi:hypothetical protein